MLTYEGMFHTLKCSIL